MTFKRGIDPRKTMGIGHIGNPLVIEDVVYVTRRPMMSSYDETMTWSWDMETEFSPSHSMRVLLGIQCGELNPEEHAVNYCEAGTGTLKLEMLSDLLGTYVSYRGETYKIPTLNEIREMRESRHEHGNRNIHLH